MLNNLTLSKAHSGTSNLQWERFTDPSSLPTLGIALFDARALTQQSIWLEKKLIRIVNTTALSQLLQVWLNWGNQVFFQNQVNKM